MITQEEKNKRQDIINFSRGNVRYEGVILSQEVESINQNFINGLIDKTEHSKLCITQIKKELGYTVPHAETSEKYKKEFSH